MVGAAQGAGRPGWDMPRTRIEPYTLSHPSVKAWRWVTLLIFAEKCWSFSVVLTVSRPRVALLGGAAALPEKVMKP